MVMALTVCSQHAVFYKLESKFAPRFMMTVLWLYVYDINLVSLKNKNIDSKYKPYKYFLHIAQFLVKLDLP